VLGGVNGITSNNSHAAGENQQNCDDEIRSGSQVQREKVKRTLKKKGRKELN
jgi:hypothetical protein